VEAPTATAATETIGSNLLVDVLLAVRLTVIVPPDDWMRSANAVV
jgi:hypothetical protein